MNRPTMRRVRLDHFDAFSAEHFPVDELLNGGFQQVGAGGTFKAISSNTIFFRRAGRAVQSGIGLFAFTSQMCMSTAGGWFNHKMKYRFVV